MRRLTSSTGADETVADRPGGVTGRTSSSASASVKPSLTAVSRIAGLVAPATAPSRARLARPSNPAALARREWSAKRLKGGSEPASGAKSPHSAAARMRPTFTRNATLAPSRGVMTASWDNAEGLWIRTTNSSPTRTASWRAREAFSPTESLWIAV